MSASSSSSDWPARLAEHIASRTPEALGRARTTAEPDKLDAARRDLPASLSERGIGDAATEDLLYKTVIPALAQGHAGPRYYGFVTGGRTDISLLADHIVSNYDNNVQVHLPNETISTYIESLAADLVLDLLGLSRSRFPSKTLTTGATSSNIIGLSLGRQYAASKVKGPNYSVAEEGFAGVEVDVFCAGAHASIKKASAIVGIGRARVVEVTEADETTIAGKGEVDQRRRRARNVVAFDLAELEKCMGASKAAGRGIIVCPAYGEVNTGAFTPDMPEIRALCDKYGAWLHLDAAFGAFGALHPDFEQELRQGMGLADSLTLDGHKWLNVPYDCGIFYSRSTSIHEAVFGPGANAPAYLSTQASSIPSPLNVRLENSSRFRGLPLYASLVCHGTQGYAEIVQSNIVYARRIEAWLQQNEHYDVLTPSTQDGFRVLNIVLFAPSKRCPVQSFRDHDTGGHKMTSAINASGEMYVTATKWKGRSAARLAVSNHLTGRDEQDFEIVTQRLHMIMTSAVPSA